MKSPRSLFALATLCVALTFSQTSCTSTGVYAVGPAPAPVYGGYSSYGVATYGAPGFYHGAYGGTYNSYSAYGARYGDTGVYRNSAGGSAYYHNGSGAAYGARGGSAS